MLRCGSPRGVSAAPTGGFLPSSPALPLFLGKPHDRLFDPSKPAGF